MPSMMPSVRQHLHLYIFVSIIFVTGVVFGALLVNALTLDQQEELSRQLKQVFLSAGETPTGNAFWDSLWQYWRWILIIAVFGISIIGFPLILVMDFAKGMFIGFTVGTLVGQYSWKGIIVAAATIAPQNMIAIPLLLIASVSSLAFSLHVLKNRLMIPKMKSLKAPFINYMTVQVTACIGLAGAAAVVHWISPVFMTWVGSTIIHG